MIEVQGVCKDYGAIRALTEVSFRIDRGEIVGLLGPNGAGKTTLLKVLTGVFEPSQGRVQIHGVDVAQDSLSVRRRIGYLPENAPLYPELLVQESLQMTADLRGLQGADREQKLIRAIQAVGLGAHLVTPIGHLSKGFRQRVGLAQAILHQPELLILDEPTNGLDPEQIVEVRYLIRELASQATVILSTHILSEVEQTCERVLVLMEGRLRADARLADLRTTNRYRVAFAGSIPAEVIRTALESLPEVATVRLEPATQDRIALLIEGPEEVDLGALLFEQARKNDWPLRELRPDVRSLESVFQQLRSGREVQL